MRDPLKRRAAVWVAIAAVLAAGCQSAGSAAGRDVPAPTPPSAQLIVSPPDGTRNARPDLPVTLQAVKGKIQRVTVTGRHTTAEGSLSADGTQWRSRWTLAPSTAYAVTAAVLGVDGKTATLTSTFTTLKPKQIIRPTVTVPYDREIVGVGMPIMLRFDRPVFNKAEVERALEVRMSQPVEGAWRWAGDQQVIFRPRQYWTSGQQVTLVAHLNGVRAAKDVYATRDLRIGFTIGDAVVSTVNTKTFQMTVAKNGKMVRRIPISAGRATKRVYTTTNGIHVVSEKVSPVIFDSETVGIPKGHPEYYRIVGYWAVRISDSGEYVHSAPWSAGDQGRRNVSHGCVNANPANAEWFYRLTRRGDIVTVTGTNRELEWNNGWGFWQLSWQQWVKGSAPPATPSLSPTR